ncbi:MAG: MarR family transcriptional regulator [Candidatus Dadabacteria bacterium]|nr:MAG: MarR family transcriptional regulator [Candidatus Dadabacteria bacterium]
MPTHYDGPEHIRRALDLFIKLERAHNAVLAVTQTQIREAGLTTSQFGVLEALYHLGPLCQRALADKILKTGGNLTTVIDNLERNGLVRRERSTQDRRFITVHLTDAGRELIARIFPAHAEDVARAFAPLTATEQTTLASLLKKLGTTLTKGDQP